MSEFWQTVGERRPINGFWQTVGETFDEAHDGVPVADALDRFTPAQRDRLVALCIAYGVEFVEDHYWPQFDLPPGYVAGWIGGRPGTLYVGVDEDGVASS